MDLKYPFVIPDDFNNDNFGNDRQARMLSYLDKMLGDLFQCIDMNNSIVVFSSDHGDYIPVTNHDLSDIPTIQNIMRKGKKIFPSLEPTGTKLFEIMKKTTGDIRKKNFEKKLSELELRGFSDRNKDVLFDEVIHVPLIFVGKESPKMKIPNLVRHVDIFPTVSSMIGLSYDESNFDGKNLVPIMKGSKTNDLIAYIESGPANENLEGKVIGLRSLLYKYFRSRSNPNDMVHLYDLTHDPLELHNIANVNPQIVENMERQLQNLKDDHDEKSEQITSEERKKIEDELRKLGYI
jgi:arylsulfatase A-like enzyme